MILQVKVTTSGILIFLLLTFILCEATIFAQGKNVVPGNGLVVRKRSSLWKATECEPGFGKYKEFCSYLRFHSDGVVIGVTTPGTPNNLKKWFRRPYHNKGVYKIRSENIKFSLTSKEGTVDYEGFIRGDRLYLKIHSHINEYRHDLEYRWVRPRNVR